MAGGCKVTSQTFMIIIGLVFWGAAAACVYVGTFVFQSYGNYEQITTSKLVLIPAIISICVGGIMFAAGIMACCSACNKNRCLLATFFLFLLVIFSFLLVAGILGYVYKGKVETTIQDGLRDTIGSYGNDSTITTEIDYMQNELTCCGISNYTDWEDTDWGRAHEGLLPTSCCRMEVKNGTCDLPPAQPALGDAENILHGKGCYDQMRDMFTDYLAWIAGIATGFAVILIIGMVSTCVLFWQKREEVPYANLSGSGFTV